MDHLIRTLFPSEFPSLLREIPDLPTELYLKGTLPQPDTKLLAIVGSRNYSNYGKQLVEHFVRGLRGHPISIVSGLALGIDALAHEAALREGLHTVAVPGSGLGDPVLYPRSNFRLAHRILEAGGALLSEYAPDFQATTWSFPKRNRIMAGMSHATLIIEASERSGTLITARLAAEYNRELLVVPGNIFSENSKGPHQFLKLGATPVTTPEDILEVLHLEKHEIPNSATPPLDSPEQMVLSALTEPTDRDALIRTLALPIDEANVLLMRMELNGLINEQNGLIYKT